MVGRRCDNCIRRPLSQFKSPYRYVSPIIIKRQIMKEYILNFVLAAVVIYALGFGVVMLNVANGYAGGDMLTEHYRSVLQMFVK